MPDAVCQQTEEAKGNLDTTLSPRTVIPIRHRPVQTIIGSTAHRRQRFPGGTEETYTNIVMAGELRATIHRSIAETKEPFVRNGDANRVTALSRAGNS